jgi:hypothetical protein
MRAAARTAVAAAKAGRRLLPTHQAPSSSFGLAHSTMTGSELPSTQLSEFTQRQLGSDVIDFSAGQASLHSMCIAAFAMLTMMLMYTARVWLVCAA